MTPNDSFKRTAGDYRESSFVMEIWTLLRERKKYWMIPVVAVLLVLGLLVFLSGTAAAPFIYTLF
jgi:fluoride ion exporter CrcB/FEX